MQKTLTRISSSVAVFTVFIHLFCCGLPLLASASGLVGVLGLSGAEALEIEFLHVYEKQIFIFSGLFLMVTGLIQSVSLHLDCREMAACHHKPCGPQKRTSLNLFFAACTLFVANGLLHAFNVLQ